MPIYQNSTPPYALSSGDVGFSFNNEAFPAANTAGSQFALPSYTGIADGGTAVRWQTIFGTAPSAVSIVLQAAMAMSMPNTRPSTQVLPLRAKPVRSATSKQNLSAPRWFPRRAAPVSQSNSWSKRGRECVRHFTIRC